MQLELPFFRISSIQPETAIPPPRQPEERVEFVRVRHARRYILRVLPDGTLRVTLPRWGSKREARAFVETQRRWIERERARVRAEHAPRAWADGTMVPLRGAPVRLTIEEDGSRRWVLYGGRRVRVPDGRDVRQAIEADLRALARDHLIPRLHELAATHGLTVRGVTIRNQRSRWGSCSREGTVALNFRLIQMPPEVCDYVLVHELMHMRQQNHSIRFWRLVEAACPGFRDAERWLKDRGKALF